MKTVIKRDNTKKDFSKQKIANAILKAAEEHRYDILKEDVRSIADDIEKALDELGKSAATVEEIQDLVIKFLKVKGHQVLAKKYHEYREERTKAREMKTSLMNSIEKIGVETDRDNANVGNNFSAKLLRIASEANKWHILSKLPKEMSKAHETGDYYIHDLDSYNLTINCLHLPTRKLLSEGFNTGYGMTNPAKRIETAAALCCIMMQSSQNDMFGGQSHPNFDNDLAPFVKMTRDEIKAEFASIGVTDADKIEKEVIKKVKQAMQSVIYNLNTMHSRAGAQVPFSSINVGIPDSKEAAMLCQAILEEYYNGMGNGEVPIFPNIIFRVKAGVNRNPEDPYYYLFKLATAVASERMNPTFMNMDADFNKVYFDTGLYPSTMGCRTYVIANINGPAGGEGRGNIAPVTINLVRLGILANKNIDTFFKLFEEMIENCRLQLMHRYSVVKKLRVQDLPFVAGQKIMKGSENLEPGDSIEPILKQGTWGIGFIGLAETLKALTGKHHGESEESQALGIRIVSFLRNKLDEYKEKYKLNFSCYATPAEGLSGKFNVLDEKVLGKYDWITTKGFYTNSFHVPVDYPISISKKIEIEAPYHKLCNAGHISYIEFDDNPSQEVVERVVRTAYEKTNISYIGINFHIRYCLECADRLTKQKAEKGKESVN